MKNKQTTKSPEKLHNPWQHKNSTYTLIKQFRLMEVTGRHNFIKTGTSDLVFWNSIVTEMRSLNKK